MTTYYFDQNEEMLVENVIKEEKSQSIQSTDEWAEYSLEYDTSRKNHIAPGTSTQ